MVDVYSLRFQNRTCSESATQDLECGTNDSVHVDYPPCNTHWGKFLSSVPKVRSFVKVKVRNQSHSFQTNGCCRSIVAFHKHILFCRIKYGILIENNHNMKLTHFLIG